MRARDHRAGFESAAAIAAMAFGWSAACSWQGMVAEPAQYLVPALVAAALVAGVGTAGRVLALRWYAVLGLQIVTLLVWFHHRQNPDGAVGGWLPTPGGVAEVINQVRDGSDAVNRYTAPVPGNYTDAPVYLIACALLILLLIDLIACGLRLPAWAGIPALVAVAIPINVLDQGLPAPVYVATGLLFAVLLAVLEADRATAWGPVVGRPGTAPSGSARLSVLALGTPALVISTAATALALAVAPGVPVASGLFHDGLGAGPDGGGKGRVTLSNPLVDLRRDLVRNDRLPLLDVRTRSRDVSYLRLTVLDSFVDDSWTPSPRDLATDNAASGPLPAPAGVNLTGARPTEWDLRTTAAFETTWLPTPSLTRTIEVDAGDWRYDPRFGDIAAIDDPPPTEVPYRLTAVAPSYSAAGLAAARPAPPAVVTAMTKLPTLPPTVKEIAERVTAAGTTQHAKAVLLQDWFRRNGGFTYSLDPAPGGGLDQLARFITTDKVGYCEQFAAAMAVMARALGIPARVVVGFLAPSEKVDGAYRFTSDDLHAWPEIYFAGSGWVRFEPTPGARTGTAPTWTRDLDRDPAPTPSPSTATSSPTRPTSDPSTAAPEAARGTTDGPTGTASIVASVIAGSAALLLLLGAPGVLRVRQRHRRLRRDPDPVAAAESLWAELRATAIDLALPWPDDRSPRMVAEVLRAVVDAGSGTATPSGADDLALLVALVERARYQDGFELTSHDHATAVSTVRRWSGLLTGTVAPTRARLARVLPASLVRS